MRALGAFVVLAAACGGAAAVPPAPAGGPPVSPPAPSPSASAAPGRPEPAPPPAGAPSPAEVFGGARDALAACYARGRAEIPTMTSGRVTLHAAIDAAGRTMCVVPSDDTGLTQDVETCMREGLARASYARTGAAWSTALPIVVKDGELSLGAPRTTPGAIETIESQGLTEEVYDVVERLLPDLYACMQGLEKSAALRVVYVGGQVGADGRVTCALASSASPVPEEKRACAERVLSGAVFRPPKKGWGLVSVPLNVLGR